MVYFTRPTRAAILMALATLGAADPSGHGAEMDPSLSLWYTRPAQTWEEALPVGNGRLGAMVFGRAAHERIQLNEDTIWTGGPYPQVKETNGPEALKKIRQWVFEGRYREAQNLFTNCMNLTHWGYATYQPLGNLWLDFPEHNKVRDYRRSLDLDTAVVTVEYRCNGTTFRREVFSSPADQVMVVRLTANRPGQMTFEARLEGVRNLRWEGDEYYMSKSIAPDTLVLQGRVASGRVAKGQIEYQTRMIAQIEGGAISSEHARLIVRDANAATLVLAAATNFVNYRDLSADPQARVLEQLNAVKGKAFEVLRMNHLKEHRRLFRRATLEMVATDQSSLPTDQRLKAYANACDPQLAALAFNFGRYLLVCSSRPGSQPANLQGIWNEDMNPSWDCKFTTNINLEMNYWPAEVCNLSECVEPLVAMVEDWAEMGAITAERHYGVGGWVQHFNSDLWRVTDPLGEGYFGTWHGAGAWICSHLWEHYLFTEDREFLKRVYPVMKGAAQFYLETLVQHPNRPYLVTCPSNSPENWYKVGKNPRRWDPKLFEKRLMTTICAGPTCDNQMLRYLFDACIEAGRLLNTDEAFAERVKAARAKLAPNQIGKHGQLQEWLEDWDDPEDDHRHFTHLWGMYPGNEISVEKTPDLAKAVRQSLIYRAERGTGFGMAWQMCLWARMYDAEKALKLFKNLIRDNSFPNLFSNCFGTLQVDGSFGATAGLAEMLLQSQHGEVHLLPALPRAWSQGRATGWRARGGFEVDFTWKDATLSEVSVRSLKGNACRIRYGGKTVELPTQRGQVYRLDGALQKG